MRGPAWVLAACLCVGIALVTLPSGGRERRIALEETSDDSSSDESRIAKLEEESKDKAIEAAIRKAASELEIDRANALKNKAMAEDARGEAIEDKKNSIDYFERAKLLASESERSKASAKIAEQQAMAMGKVLKLKTAVATLSEEKADVERKRADRADKEAEEADSRVEKLKAQIASLRREARAKSTEADARVDVANKLLARAKQLTVAAKTLQEKELMDKPETPTVSPEALSMIKQEAQRVAALLKKDSEQLHVAEEHAPKEQEDAEH